MEFLFYIFVFLFVSIKASMVTTAAVQLDEFVIDYGEYSGIAINPLGFPSIVFYSDSSAKVYLVTCYNENCTEATRVQIDKGFDSGKSNRIKFLSDGTPFIAFVALGERRVKFVSCDDLACSSGPKLVDFDTVSTSGNRHTIALDISPVTGFPIAFYTSTGTQTSFLVCEDLKCENYTLNNGCNTIHSQWSISTMAIAVDGRAVGFYRQQTGGEKLVSCSCDLQNCNNTTKVDLGSGSNIPAVLDAIRAPSGEIIVTSRHHFQSGGAKVHYIKCMNTNCSSRTDNIWTHTGTVDYIQLSIIDGLPKSISIGDGSDILFTNCTNLECSSRSVSTLVSGTGFQFSSITPNSTLPFYGYYASNTLFISRCTDSLCSSSVSLSLPISSVSNGFNVLASVRSSSTPILVSTTVNSQVGVHFCHNADCSFFGYTIVHDGVNWQPSGSISSLSVTLNSNEYPIILAEDALNDGTAHIIACNSISCGGLPVTKTIVSLFSAGSNFLQNFAIQDPYTNTPFFLVSDSSNVQLKNLICTNSNCSSYDIDSYSGNAQGFGYSKVIHGQARYWWHGKNGNRKYEFDTCYTSYCNSTIINSRPAGSGQIAAQSGGYFAGINETGIVSVYYQDTSLVKLGYCSNTNCSNFDTKITLNDNTKRQQGGIGGDTSILGTPLFCWAQLTNDIVCLSCENNDCSNYSINSVSGASSQKSFMQIINDKNVSSDLFLGFFIDQATTQIKAFQVLTYCPPGKKLGGSLDCIPCEIGTFQNVENREFSCSPCSSGTFTNIIGQTNCSVCSAGFYSPATNALCEPCAAGHWSDDGAASCTPCLDGYISLSNHTGCEQCPAGYVTNENRTECIECPAGSYSFGLECLPCQERTFYDSVNNLCKSCPGFRISPESSTSKTQCLCEENYYVSDPEKDFDSDCLPCPEGANCAGAFATPTAGGGFSTSLVDPEIFVACPYPERCLEEDKCENGYQGFLCSECQTDYYKTGDSCHKCSDGSSSLLILGFIFMFFILGIFIRINQRGHSFGAVSAITEYLQYFTVFGHFRVAGNTVWNDTFSVPSIFIFDFSSVAPECNNQGFNWYTKMQVQMALPLVVLICYFLWAIILWIGRLSKLKKKSTQDSENSIPTINEPNHTLKQRSLYSIIFGSILYAFTLIHMIVLRSCFALLDCEQLNDGERVVASEPNLSCDTDDYIFNRNIGIVVLISFGFGLPIFSLVSYFRYRNFFKSLELKTNEVNTDDNSSNDDNLVPIPPQPELDEDQKKFAEEIHTKYGVFFDKYIVKYGYWESVIGLRRIILTAFIELLTSRPVYSISLVFLSLLAFLLLQNFANPFWTQPLNMIQRFTLIFSSVTVFFALCLTSSSSDDAFKMIIAVLNILTVLSALGVLFYFASKHYFLTFNKYPYEIFKKSSQTELFHTLTPRTSIDVSRSSSVSKVSMSTSDSNVSDSKVSDTNVSDSNTVPSLEEMQAVEMKSLEN